MAAEGRADWVVLSLTGTVALVRFTTKDDFFAAGAT